MQTVDDISPLNVLAGKKLPGDTGDFLAEKFPGLISTVGRYSYGGPNVHHVPGDSRSVLKIGAYCSIADEVEIFCGMGGRHQIDFLTTFPMTMVYDAKPSSWGRSRTLSGDLSVHIGSDVWIGQRATILNGVRIGHGAVIGSGAVVRKDVRPYEIVVGNPQQHARYRFAPEIVARLLKVRWWDWPDQAVRDHIDLFYNEDMEAVLAGLEAVASGLQPVGDDTGPVFPED
jgi:chloramphenicol O-acetyltransferase type B